MGGEHACKSWMCSAPYVREVDGRLRGFVKQTCKDCGREVEVASVAPSVPRKTNLERMIDEELPGLSEVEEEDTKRVAPKDSLIARHQRYMERREEIVKACEATLWIVSEAARILRIPHSTLWKLLEQDFGINVKAKRREALVEKKEQKPGVVKQDVVLEVGIDPKNLDCCALEVIERGLANCKDLDDVRAMIRGLKLVKPLLPMCPTLVEGKLPAPA